MADNSVGFWHGFIASISVIIVSELGDKTWFIAVIMAMKHSSFSVFLGATGATTLMTILSACLGWATQIIPRKLTYYVSTTLFALFGLKMLKEGYEMSPNEGQEEYEDAQNEICEMEHRMTSSVQSSKCGLSIPLTRYNVILHFVSKVFIQAFALTFFAEWGDRSQITTIILAAREDVIGVTIGCIIGNAICTAIAVIGGRIIAQRISLRTVTLIGGVVFIVFSLSAFIFNPDDAI